MEGCFAWDSGQEAGKNLRKSDIRRAVPAKIKRFTVFIYSGLNLNQDKATKPQTVQIVRQGEATPYWFKVNPL
ncbi:hypothetical protein NEISICOT_00495 [Neisseria sicca ATCC 29256]|uniref:Uncharacterized protein n=1 Tax=Neisseria sicca ATCC 29256 TaxID=547045 RepID=C6M1V7_NEISI|nr:hypothetical protein NEISICOT_00495 [Neisseria sicca ATCC 29256]